LHRFRIRSVQFVESRLLYRRCVISFACCSSGCRAVDQTGVLNSWVAGARARLLASEFGLAICQHKPQLGLQKAVVVRSQSERVG
jgi:hypothetical protein